MHNPVGWFEIYVQDIDRARAFYESVFDIKLDKLEMSGMEMWTFPMEKEAKGCSGAIVKMDGSPSGSSIMVYFSCEDCAIEQQRAAEYSGKVVREKYSIGEYGFVSLVTDTEGNMIGLHSHK